jgi:predicted negative regulator of RcsB-dependent stress response
MIERDLAADRIDRQEAIERLERLRFAWRGDEFEAVLLRRLASLYEQEQQYRKALRTLEQVSAHLPNTPQAAMATEEMREIFVDLFLDGEADNMQPVKALALYEDFRELTPPGETGNRLIARLADRLVQVDLLSRAAELLEGQVQHRLEGEAKAQTGARLASIYLLDRRPEEATEALDDTAVNGMPPDLIQQRSYLRSRALMEAGRLQVALIPIAADERPEANRIRAKIYAEMGNWERVADNLAALLPPRPGPDTEFSQESIDKVMRQAVALALGGDQGGLNKLRQTYGEAMAKTDQAEAFEVLTTADATDPSEVGAQLAQVQRARTFVDGFLNSLRQQASLEQ